MFRKKWLNFPMNEIYKNQIFVLMGEKEEADYEELIDLLLQSCKFIGNYYDETPFFQVRCFKDIESFSKAAKRPIDPGWMGSPVKGEINAVVLSLDTEKETGSRVRFHSHLVHEISHTCFNHIGWKYYDDSFSFPAWLEEGVCMWLESVFREQVYQDKSLRENLQKKYKELREKGVYIPLSSMDVDLCLLDDPNKYSYGIKASYGYCKAFLAVDYIIDKHGTEFIFNPKISP